MPDAAPTPEDELEFDRRLLARGAELALRIMERLEARIAVTDDAFELEALAKGFERVHRGERMAIALRRRLERARDLREAADAEAPANDDRKDRAPVFVRRVFVSPFERGLRPEVIRLIETEVERDEIEDYIRRMDAWLERPEPGFMDLAAKDQFHRVIDILGFNAPGRRPREDRMLPYTKPYAARDRESSG